MEIRPRKCKVCGNSFEIPTYYDKTTIKMCWSCIKKDYYVCRICSAVIGRRDAFEKDPLLCDFHAEEIYNQKLLGK